MHNPPYRGVNYHIFDNEGNYPVITIYEWHDNTVFHLGGLKNRQKIGARRLLFLKFTLIVSLRWIQVQLVLWDILI